MSVVRESSRVLDRLVEPRVFAPLLALAAAALAVLYASRAIPTPDEGALLANASKVLDGAVYYRDIDAYPFPLATWLLVLAMAVFGESVVVARAIAGLLFVVMVLALYFTALRLTDAGRAALFGLLFLALKPLLYPAFSLYLYSELAFAASCVAISCFVWGRSPVSLIWLAASGAFAALAVLSKQNLGIALAGASAGVLLLPGIVTGEPSRPGATRSRLVSLAAYSLGLSVPLIAFLLQLAADGVALTALDSGLLRPFSHYLPTTGVGFAPMLRWWELGVYAGPWAGIHYLPAHPVAALSDLCGPDAHASWIALEAAMRVLYTSLPVVFVWLVVRRVRVSRASPRQADVIAFGVLAAAVVSSAWPRTDVYHVTSVYPVVALLWMAMSAAGARPPRRPGGSAVVVALLLVASGLTAAWHVSATTIPVELDRARLRVTSEEAWVAPLVRALREEVAPGEPLFVLGNEAYLYFLADRYFPWPFAQLYPGQTGSDGGELLVEMLRDERPRLVVLGRAQIGLPPLADYAPAVLSWAQRDLSMDRGFAGRHSAGGEWRLPAQMRVMRPRRIPASEAADEPLPAQVPRDG